MYILPIGKDELLTFDDADHLLFTICLEWYAISSSPSNIFRFLMRILTGDASPSSQSRGVSGPVEDGRELEEDESEFGSTLNQHTASGSTSLDSFSTKSADTAGEYSSSSSVRLKTSTGTWSSMEIAEKCETDMDGIDGTINAALA